MRLAKSSRQQLPVLFDYAPEPEFKPDTSTLLPLDEYYRVIFLLSGKDSVFAMMRMLERGVDPAKAEIWHHPVDGKPLHLGGSRGLFDWPVSTSYVAAAGAALGIPVRYQWREGGLEREMLRENEYTQPCSYQLEDYSIKTSGGLRGELLTRQSFPQAAAITQGRYCSPVVKIGVAGVAICGDPRFSDKNILLITGERRQESPNRSKYATIEKHRTTTLQRRADHHRPILEEDEAAVWDCLRYYRIHPHPCYFINYSRASCMGCVFCGYDEWSTVRALDPERFNKIAAYEVKFGRTIKQGMSVIEQADRGRSFIREGDEPMCQLVMSDTFPADRFIIPAGEPWVLPRGAFRHGAGPS
ncbi:MAG: phosphoadenosine phosphosulfate reductase family protein [Pyrinomonadaceae bacterium]